MGARAGSRNPRPAAPAPRRTRADVCAIVVSHDSERWLGPALTSLFEHAGDVELDVVIADNGGDGAGHRAAERFDGVRSLQCPNRGFAHANNRAALTSDARYLLFINPDVELVDGTVSDLVSHMDAHPEIGIAGCRQVDERGRLWPTVRRFPSVGRALGEALGPERFPFKAAWLGETELNLSSYGTELACDWTSGSFLLVRREALERAGLLDERFFFYSEEIDLCLRVRQAGWQVHHLPLLTIVHYGGETGADPRLEAQMAYARRQYAYKHFSPLRRAAFLAAIGLRHLIRWAIFSRAEGDRRALAHRRAFLTLFGRVEPPFGPPPAGAETPRLPAAKPVS
jgi:N-acetylglucosaminyl-diphospho-decaprenol L-rhamnosyltransferase